MDNNLLQMLSGLLGKNNTSGMQNINNSANFSEQKQPPLYPVEPFSIGQNSQNTMQNNFAEQNSQSQNNTQNNMLPLLLSLMGGQNGSQFEALGKLFSNEAPSNMDINSLATLFSSLSKNKKSSANDNIKKEDEVSSSNQVIEGELPSNDLY